MRCNTCGGEVPTGRAECDVCHTPANAPAVEPGVRTYGVRGVGLAAVGLVALAAMADLVVGLFPLIGQGIARRALESGDVEPLNRAVLTEAGLGVLDLLAWVAAGVMVIIWCHRARKNLDAFPGAGPTMAAGWAIGGWFLPFANFVIPCRVVANIARDSLWKLRTPALVGVWWAAWLVYLAYDRFAGRSDARAYEALPVSLSGREDLQAYVDYYGDAIGRNVPSMVAVVVAGAALIVLILRISRAQEVRIERGRAVTPVLPGMTVASPVVPQRPPTGGGATIGA